VIAVPLVRASWVVHRSEGWLVVDKPPLVPVLPSPDRGDDLLTRVRRAFGDEGWSTIAQLETPSSGLVVFARGAGRSVFAALEGSGGVVRTYRAAVVGTCPATRRLEGAFDRRARRAPAGPGEAMVVDLRRLATHADRSHVELRLTRGRPGMLRALLETHGLALVGDTERGGPPLHRLALHLRRLELPGGVVAEAPEDSEIEAEIRADGQGSPPLEMRLERAVDRRLSLAESADTDAYRLVHGAGDGLPGLELDRYGDYLVAHLVPERLAVAEEEVLDAIARLGPAGVIRKVRPKKASDLDAGDRQRRAPSTAARGETPPPVLSVREAGLGFEVALTEGLSTGIFLDQRDNRAWVRSQAAGAEVLNLFAYTGGFSVAAAAGGARRTLSVDAAGPALERAARNLSSFAGEHRTLKTDVFSCLEWLATEGRRFDLVVVDPPTYSTTRRSRWQSGADWRGLLSSVLAVTKPRGQVLACSNDRRMSIRAFDRFLTDGAEAAGARGIRLQSVGVPFDFPPAPGRDPHLKTTLVTRAEERSISRTHRRSAR
jgi:23S rRNA (cytosine1962-C5)-methyltransferase